MGGGAEVGIVNGEGPRGRDSQWGGGAEVGIVNGEGPRGRDSQ